MKKINFEPIGEAMKLFDTDKIDIARHKQKENEDGTISEEKLETIYTNVYCHLSFSNVDNADSNTAETRPIIKILTINCPVDVDLQNGDFITAYKLANDESVIETYQGAIGEPTSSMSRKNAEMQIKEDI